MSLQVVFLSLAAVLYPLVNAECQRQCGNVSVPFPFSLGENPECYHDPSFRLRCDETFSPAKLTHGKSMRVANISVETGTASVETWASYTCYNKSGHQISRWKENVNLEGSPFTFSNSENVFTTIGCSALGVILGTDEDQFGTGCYSMCNKRDRKSVSDDFSYLTKTHSCLGVSCCQTPIPKNLKELNIGVINFDNFSCSYGFLGPKNYTLVYENKYPISVAALDWGIGNQTCEEAEPICGHNTKCINPQNGPGYQCSCKEGFQGNPYERKGCSDIDECSEENRNNYTCHGTCQNTPGNYSCHCSFPRVGDGKVGCQFGILAKVIIGIGSGILIAACVLPQCWMYKRRRKEKNQRRNGGLFLKHLSVKIYQEQQLHKATNGYNRENLLGEGGYGCVYKGSEGKTEIAVKKSKVINEDQIEHAVSPRSRDHFQN